MVGDWYVLHRAGILSQQCKIRNHTKTHSLVKVGGESGSRGCFFLDTPLSCSTVVVPIGSGSWREDVKKRLQRGGWPESVCQDLAGGAWRLDGAAVATDALPSSLIDTTLRITIPGLRGGMPPKQNLCQKSKAELVALCNDRDIPHAHRSRDQLLEDLDEWDKQARLQKARERMAKARDSRDSNAKAEELAKQRERMAKPETVQKAKERNAKAEELAKARKRMVKPEALEANRKRKSTDEARKADRKRKATPKELEKATARMAESYKGVQKKFRERFQYARADREREASVVDGLGLASPIGTWQEAARIIAEAEGQQSLQAMPPSFAILNDEQCLRQIGQMYAFLDDVRWSTCVVCWRAWYNPNVRYDFEKTISKSGEVSKWFNPYESVVLGCQRQGLRQWRMQADGNQRDYASRYLKSNYPSSVADSIALRLINAESKRDIVVCSMCLPDVDVATGILLRPVCTRNCDYVIDPVTVTSAHPPQHERWQEHQAEHERIEDPRAYVLGLSIEEFAPAVSLLSDSEEMVLSLIHPLLQTYTLRSTGQVAYVGHVCNFRQKVSKFISSLPTVPQDMPFVQIRPRSIGNRPSFRAPFKVNVEKLRHAFEWLKKYNPYYHDVEWLEASAAEWLGEDIQLPTREESETEREQAVPVNHEIILAWMQRASHAQSCGDGGFAIGSRLLAVLELDVEDTFELWNGLRAMAADILSLSSMRAATSLEQEAIALVLHEHGKLELGLNAAGDAKAMMAQLKSMPCDEWTLDYTVMRQELSAIFLEMMQDEPIISMGAMSEPVVGDDVGVREECLNEMEGSVAKRFGGGDGEVDEQPDDATCAASETQPADSAAGLASASERKCKYPRRDPPEIEDGPGMAVREDMPGSGTQSGNLEVTLVCGFERSIRCPSEFNQRSIGSQ